MKKTKLILIGYGNMGKNWMSVIIKRRDIGVVGVVDFIEKNRMDAQHDFSLTNSQVSGDLSKLLIDFAPDVIIDCSPPAAHYDNAILILKYKCHILGEKPIALNFSQAKKLVESFEKKKRLYMVNQNYRRNPLIEIIKKNLLDIGKIISVNVNYYQSLEFNDTFRYKFDHPLIMDMSVHHFDLVRLLLNQNANSVFALEYNPSHSKFKNGSDVSAVFRMGKEVIFSYNGSWSAIGHSTSFNGEWRIIGERGTLVWDGNLSINIEIIQPDGKMKCKSIIIPKKLQLQPHDLFLHELSKNLDMFLHSIKTSQKPDTWAGDNLNTLTMVLSAIKSSNESKIIAINRND